MVELAKLARDSKKMLQRAMNAFIHEDIDLSRAVCAEDDFIDKLHDRIFENLIRSMNISVEAALHINRISKNYERIADLSTNIAQNTIYICQGRIEKHVPKLAKTQNKGDTI